MNRENKVNAIGAAELAVGQFVYRRIEALMNAKAGSPEAAELDYLTAIAEDVEEYGASGDQVEQRAPFQDDHGEEAKPSRPELGCIKPDTDAQVFFYEQDFYVLSNFSAFAVEWSGFLFPTSEHLYHWLRFTLSEDSFGPGIARDIFRARSAHDAFKIAQENKRFQVGNWNEAKVEFMRRVLKAKAEQHEYVRRKLLATDDRELIEDSWRDDFWGWGPNRDGQNMLGKLWMEIRAELRNSQPVSA